MQEVFAKIIERLEEENRKGHYDFNSVIGEKNVWQKAIEIVKQEAEKFGADTNVGSNGWISVSERLPEEKINPVTQDYYQYPVMFENDGVEDIKYYYFGNGHWRYGLQIMDCYVTHWMDIKPYQPKGE